MRAVERTDVLGPADAVERDLTVSERIEPTHWSERRRTQRAREKVTRFARREL